MLEQWVTREAIIGRNLEVMQCRFWPTQQRVGRCHGVSDMMEMLESLALCERFSNLGLCLARVARLGSQQRLHCGQRATSVLRFLCKESVDPFLSFVRSSQV